LDSAKTAHTHDLAQGPIHHLRDITRRFKCAALVCLDDRSLDLAPRLSLQADDKLLDLTLDVAYLLEFLFGPIRIIVDAALQATGDALKQTRLGVSVNASQCDGGGFPSGR